MDILNFKELDKRTIEHTDTLLAHTSYVYTLMTDEFMIKKTIETPKRGYF